MHKEILNINQIEILSLMQQFKREYYLVGGTAIALYIGHRRSIDFDMFKLGRLNHKRNILSNHFTLQQIVERSIEIFGELFSEKLFRAQLSYFEDIDYSEKVDYIISSPPKEEQIKDYLTKISLEE